MILEFGSQPLVVQSTGEDQGKEHGEASEPNAKVTEPNMELAKEVWVSNFLGFFYTT